MTSNNYRAMCFVDMPFGKKKDLASGKDIDFDHIYTTAIKPAIEDAGLEPLRGDEERTGGVIHTAMFARLLLSEYVVADLTLANPNVFYELGIRHAAKPFTTIPIFANVHPLPFDVTMIRAIIYELNEGKLTDKAAKKLQLDLGKRLTDAIRGPATKDSPLFQLIPEFPEIDLPHQVTDAFQDRVKHEKKFQEVIDEARSKSSNKEKTAALLKVQKDLGDLKKVQRNVLVDLLLSFRDAEAWDEMADLCESFPDYVKDVVVVRQQWALALNRTKDSVNREKAKKILEDLMKKHGSDPETLGILGRIYKDQYREEKDKEGYRAKSALDEAINVYSKGFESDPRDYFPGVNALTLLYEKGDEASMKEMRRMIPLVNFAVARWGGAGSEDYWVLATVLELACLDSDWKTAKLVLPKAQFRAKASWMPKTTRDNLILIRDAGARRGQMYPELDEIIEILGGQVAEMEGAK